MPPLPPAYPPPRRAAARAALAALLLLGGAAASGCRRGDDAFRVAETPKHAASQLEAAFAGSAPQFQGAARAASEALQNGDYQSAVESLQTIKASQDVTAQQGMAVHSSLVALEASLISAMDAGDARARQAYERLKALKSK
ncbi:MAG: hypothetical protein ACKOET_06460 [Verrucomicrobiota bacterium]